MKHVVSFFTPVVFFRPYTVYRNVPAALIRHIYGSSASTVSQIVHARRRPVKTGCIQLPREHSTSNGQQSFAFSGTVRHQPCRARRQSVTEHFQTETENAALRATTDINRRLCGVSGILAPRYMQVSTSTCIQVYTYLLPSHVTTSYIALDRRTHR